jgi:hypothetical protein
MDMITIEILEDFKALEPNDAIVEEFFRSFWKCLHCSIIERKKV